LSAFVGIWCGLHAQVAQLSGNPELAISEDDGRAFLGSLQNVLRHYPITASQKALDWAAFAFTASFIYVPRFAAVQKRAREAPPGNRPPPMSEGVGAFRFTQPPGAERRPNGAGFAPPPPVPPTVDMSIEPEMEQGYDA
jgi:hypothetical protein